MVVQKTIKPVLEEIKKSFDLSVEKENKEEDIVLILKKMEKTFIKLAEKDFQGKLSLSILGRVDKTTHNENFNCHLNSGFEDSLNVYIRLHFLAGNNAWYATSYNRIKEALRFKRMDFEKADEYIKEMFGQEYSGTAEQKSLKFDPFTTYVNLHLRDFYQEEILKFLEENEIVYTTSNEDKYIHFIDFQQFVN